jgi:fluoroacetyl-CoA thioesterase
MKASLTSGLSTTRRVTVDEKRTVDFMGEEARVYATPEMVRDMEYTCRNYLLEHLDAGEDSVGARVEIEHLAPTLLGMWVEVTATVAEVKGRFVSFDFTVRDALDEVGRGRHTRFVTDVSKTRGRLAAKRQKAQDAGAL